MTRRGWVEDQYTPTTLARGVIRTQEAKQVSITAHFTNDTAVSQRQCVELQRRACPADTRLVRLALTAPPPAGSAACDNRHELWGFGATVRVEAVGCGMAAGSFASDTACSLATLVARAALSTSIATTAVDALHSAWMRSSLLAGGAAPGVSSCAGAVDSQSVGPRAPALTP